MFSRFQSMKFIDFVDNGKLPISSSGLTKQFPDAMVEILAPKEDIFAIFISHRWVGGGNGPDDGSGNLVAPYYQCCREVQENESSPGSRLLRLWLVRNIFRFGTIPKLMCWLTRTIFVLIKRTDRRKSVLSIHCRLWSCSVTP